MRIRDSRMVNLKFIQPENVIVQQRITIQQKKHIKMSIMYKRAKECIYCTTEGT